MVEIGNITARLALEGSRFKAGIVDAVNDTNRWRRGVSSSNAAVRRSFAGVNRAIRGTRQELNSLGSVRNILAGAGIVLGTKQVIDLGLAAVSTSQELISQSRALEAVSGSAEKGARNLAFANSISERLGANVSTVRASLQGLAGAFRDTALEGRGTIEIATGMTAVNSILGLTKEQADGAGIAIAQMGTKGKISQEELNQLAERGIPALKAMKDVVAATGQDFDKLQQAGKLTTEEFLLPFVRRLVELVNVDPSKRINNFTAETNRAGNAIKFASGELGHFITTSPAVNQAIRDLTEGFKLGRQAIIDNREEIEAFVTRTVTSATNIVKAIAGIESAYQSLSTNEQDFVSTLRAIGHGTAQLFDLLNNPSQAGARLQEFITQSLADAITGVKTESDKLRDEIKETEDKLVKAMEFAALPSAARKLAQFLPGQLLPAEDENLRLYINNLNSQLNAAKSLLSDFENIRIRTPQIDQLRPQSSGSIQAGRLPEISTPPKPLISVDVTKEVAGLKAIATQMRSLGEEFDLGRELARVYKKEIKAIGDSSPASLEALSAKLAEANRMSERLANRTILKDLSKELRQIDQFTTAVAGTGIEVDTLEDKINAVTGALNSVDPDTAGATRTISKIREQLDALSRQQVPNILTQLGKETARLDAFTASLRELGPEISTALGIDADIATQKIGLITSAIESINPKAEGATEAISKLRLELLSLASTKAGEEAARAVTAEVTRKIEQAKTEAAAIRQSLETPRSRLFRDSTRVIELGDLGQLEDFEVAEKLKAIQIEYGKTTTAAKVFDSVASSAAQNITKAIEGVALGTQSLEDAFANLGKTITATLANTALQKLLQLAGTAIAGAIGGGVGGAVAPTPSTTGGGGGGGVGFVDLLSASPSSVAPQFGGGTAVARQAPPNVSVILVADENEAERQREQLEAIREIVHVEGLKNFNRGPNGSPWLAAISANQPRA